MKKRIAIVVERANIALGGAERSVFELASGLRAAGAEVDILAAKGRSSAGNIHILCPREAGERTSYAAFEKALKKYLADKSYDIIHSVLPFKFADIYQPRGGSYAEAILRNAASYQNRFIESYKRLTAFANFGRSALLRAERNLCNDPDGPVVAALSEYVAGQFRQHYNLDEGRIAVVPNGVRTNKHTNVEDADRLKGQILAKLGLRQVDEPILFLFAANNFRLKGLAVLIKALHRAVCDHGADNIYLVVAGSGRSLRYRLLSKRLGVQKRILFLGSVRNIQNALSISDVAVLPSFYDPSSRFILEALAAGKGVITTRYNGASEQFADNRHGRIIDSPADVDSLAEAISYFADRDNIRNASEAITADNLREKVSVARAVAQLMGVYETIISKRRSG